MSFVPREESSMRRTWIAVLLLTLAAAGLRFAGLGRLLPHLPEPDAYVAYELQFERGDPALVAGIKFHERYPLLLAHALALLSYPEVPARAVGADSEREHLARCAWPFFVTRALVASLACLLVPLTFLLARKFSSVGGALAAGFFVATSLLHLLYSGEARPHGAHATLALAAVLCAMRVAERATLVRVGAALVAAVLAVGCLQLGLFVLPPLGLAMFLASRGARESGGDANPEAAGGFRLRGRVGLALAFLVPLAVGALGVVLFYPTLPYVDAQGFHTASPEGGGHSVPFEYLNALGLWRACVQLWMHDPILAILALCGIILGIDSLVSRARSRGSQASSRGSRANASPRASADAARDRALWIAGAYALPYFLVVSLNGEVYDRFLMPLLPYCACMAGAAAAWITARVRESLSGESARRLATGAVVAACAAWPSYAAVQFTRVACAPDSLQQAAEFLRRNARPRADKILVSPSLPLPLLYARDAVTADANDPSGKVAPWIVYQSLLDPEDDRAARYSVQLFPGMVAAKHHADEPELVRAFLDEHRPDWVVLEYSRKMRGLSTMRALAQAVEERGEIAFKSHGSAPAVSSLGTIDYQDAHDLALRIVETEAFGPPIVVFRMKR
jgi:hypothetical protein